MTSTIVTVEKLKTPCMWHLTGNNSKLPFILFCFLIQLKKVRHHAWKEFASVRSIKKRLLQRDFLQTGCTSHQKIFDWDGIGVSEAGNLRITWTIQNIQQSLGLIYYLRRRRVAVISRDIKRNEMFIICHSGCVTLFLKVIKKDSENDEAVTLGGENSGFFFLLNHGVV